MTKDLALAAAALLLATAAVAQGPPPFDIVPAHSAQSATLSVNIEDPQAFQVALEAFGEASGENEQESASDGGRVLIATAINDIDSFCGDYSNPKHNFAVLYWDSPYDSSDPIPAGADRSDFSQEMFYDVAGTGCASPPDAPLFAIAASSHNLGAGTIDVRTHAATNAYGYDSVSVGPISTNGYGHYAEAQATAALADWVYVTGPNPTATVTLTASFAPNFGGVPMPLNDSDWFSEAFDEDIRLVAPCGGEYERPDFSGDAQRPEGVESSEIALNLSLRDDFVSEEICDDPGEGQPPVCFTQWSSTSHGETVFKSDAVIYEWVDGEAPNDADCSDDVLEAVREEDGSLAGSASVQVDVATNQWIQIRTSLHVASSCDTPLLCDLSNSTGGPTQLSISSPNGTLVAWHGIAGLTRVPEPEHGVVAALGAIAVIVRRRKRRSAAALAASAAMLVLSAEPARAGDGRIEINQSCVAAGCFPGDAPGFPVSISSSGSYVLTSDLVVPDGNTSGIVVGSDASLDLGSFSVRGPGACTASSYYDAATLACTATGTGTGIVVGEGSLVRNGRVAGFGSLGISANGSIYSGSVLEDLRVENNAAGGIQFENGSVRRVNVSSNGGDGIYNVSGGDRNLAILIQDSIISGNKGNGIGLAAKVENCRITSNGAIGMVHNNAGSKTSLVADSIFLSNQGNAISAYGAYHDNEIRGNDTTGGGQVIGGMSDEGGNNVH